MTVGERRRLAKMLLCWLDYFLSKGNPDLLESERTAIRERFHRSRAWHGPTTSTGDR
jgi:hypothetical protein